jgi:cell division protein FtsW
MTNFARKQQPNRSTRPQNTGLESRRHKPDYWLGVIAAVMVALGMIVMYSISPAISAITEQPANYFIVRHIFAFAIGLIGAFVVYNVPLQKFKNSGPYIAVISVLSSIVIVAISGFAFRWIKIAGFSFQPAELMKFGLVLWLGFFLAARRSNGQIKNFEHTLRPVLIVLGILGVVVVVVQRDLGSMVVLASICSAMLIVANVPLRPIVILFASFVLLGSLAIVSTPYRRARFETFMNPESDCQNEGYHACQALIAVGSGGVFGLGVGKSVQAYGYLPETPTDSIFAIYAEKFGFIGSALMIVLIGTMIFKMLRVASCTTSWESRLVVLGFTTWIGVQSAINIGAMMGLLPLKGITLPFVSYGGSSLIFVMLGLGAVMRISCYTSSRKYDIESKTGEGDESSTLRRGNSRPHNATYRSR